MACFSDLPAELLLQILGYLKPAGADAFCMLSKHVRAVAAPFLEKHMELKRTYTNCVYCSMPYFGRGDLKFAKLLRKVLQNSEIVPYVQRLHIKNWATDVDEYVDDFDDAEFTTPKDALEVLSQAIQKCDLIDGQGLKTEWINILRQHSEHATSALLLSLLPNLITLRLDICANDHSANYLSDRISQATGTAALAQLSVVELNNIETLAGGDCDRLLVSFVLYPSMKQLFASYLSTEEGSDDEGFDDEGSDHEGYTNTWSGSPPSHFDKSLVSASVSPLTHISLANCQINASVYSALLKSTKNLTSFKYCSNVGTRLRDHEAKWFCEALLVFAKNTLRELTLYSYIEHHMGSLRDFQALECLSTSLELLWPGTPSMSNLLPRTLKQLKIRNRYGSNPVLYCEFMNELLRIKDKEIPKLKRVQYLFDRVHGSSIAKKKIQDYTNGKHVANAGVQISLNWTCVHELEEVFEVLEGSTLVDTIDWYLDDAS